MGGGVLKAAWKRCVLRCQQRELDVLDEQIESGREFQIVGAAAWKEREAKITLVQGTCKRLEKEDDLRAQEER